MASVFSGHEPNRACLGHSKRLKCWSPTTPTTLLKLERALLEKWDRIPSFLLIDSLTPCLKDVGHKSFSELRSNVLDDCTYVSMKWDYYRESRVQNVWHPTMRGDEGCESNLPLQFKEIGLDRIGEKLSQLLHLHKWTESSFSKV
ncbi:hypothetical protein TNCV_4954651 [Trichonephila clavipes]|nr:hypothetical protein TNCV_4954651 [Trichonephila clavipes]